MQDLNPAEWAVLPIKKYSTFGGRAPRAEYWWFYLGTLIVGFVLRLFDRLLGIEGILEGIFDLAILVPWLAVTIRRLHDTDRTGWWLLALIGVFAVLGFFAALGALDSAFGNHAPSPASFTTAVVAILMVLAAGVTFLVFMVLPGTEGANRYGPDPYGPDTLEEVFA